ncbi:DUF2950 domain-containing protein [Terriglobus sp. TAA 43]|uniref:DUF2950 domain-containing protein n=1 Tax=Terriglobus sp. TAA 43 TaxID=278961 RepID=UPI000645E94F|nr:DUF2950 domain-containing protein [Terriglobus sp. TAA 43]
MRTISTKGSLPWVASTICLAALACLFAPVLAAQQTADAGAPAAVVASPTTESDMVAKTFSSPEQAADALVNAAAQFDQAALIEIFGHDGDGIVFSGEPAQDKRRAEEFAAEAHEKKSVSISPRGGRRAFLLVGNEDWPFPVPIVKIGDKWSFDSRAGRRELLYRRIGENELDAIQICHGFVDAQQDYALKPREGYQVNQYAQNIISTRGKQDGLAWQNEDGTWGGPIGEKAAEAIQQGYGRGEPYHGYFFRVLKGQGPAAPLGQLDYVIDGAMIGGFALVAAPAEYGVTGVKTFIVSNDGVVYERDFGAGTANQFAKMDRFNPDKSWTPVLNETN